MPSLPDPEKRPDPKFVAPDLLGAVEGWRVWRLNLDLEKFEKPKLYSATIAGGGDGHWPARKAMQAKCNNCPESIVPSEGHGCGLYSAKTLEHLLSMSYHAYNVDMGYVMVLGQVANWGKVIEGTQGWRSEWAYPVRLWLPYTAQKLLKPLQETYGVPVGLKNYLKPPPMGGNLM